MARQQEFRWLFLPYCLLLQEDGCYVVVNRDYKPVGLTLGKHVDYAAYPVGFKFKRKLSAAQVKALSFEGSEDPSRIYLYNDGCVPTTSDADWAAYSARLKRLASYTVVVDD